VVFLFFKNTPAPDASRRVRVVFGCKNALYPQRANRSFCGIGLLLFQNYVLFAPFFGFCSFLFYAMRLFFGLLLSVFLFVSMPLRAQSGSWNILHVRHLTTDRLTLFGEAQLRSLRFYDDFHYYEVKGGASWKLNAQVSVTVGGGRYDTYMAGGTFRTPKSQQEIRTWAELGMKNTLAPLQFEHRYRAEQRFTNRGYRNRFRYRLSVGTSLYRRLAGSGELFASAWNEVFLTNRAPYFERTRSFGGLVWRQGMLGWTAGWVYQFDYRLTDEIGRSFLQVGCQVSIVRKASTTEVPVVEEN
jgi:hypothetical protein